MDIKSRERLVSRSHIGSGSLLMLLSAVSARFGKSCPFPARSPVQAVRSSRRPAAGLAAGARCPGLQAPARAWLGAGRCRGARTEARSRYPKCPMASPAICACLAATNSTAPRAFNAALEVQAVEPADDLAFGSGSKHPRYSESSWRRHRLLVPTDLRQRRHTCRRQTGADAGQRAGHREFPGDAHGRRESRTAALRPHTPRRVVAARAPAGVEEASGRASALYRRWRPGHLTGCCKRTDATNRQRCRWAGCPPFLHRDRCAG